MLTSGCVIALAGGLAPGQNSSTLGSVFDMVSEVYHGVLMSPPIGQLSSLFIAL